jgi:transcriptional regulator with XRE-family HTH domain
VQKIHAAKEFGNHFRQLRKARGLSQQKFADAADMSYRHVNFLENSRSMPSRDMVLKIADTLELSLKNTNVLLRSAGFSSVYRTTSLNDNSMGFVKAALVGILDHQNPFPGIVMSPIGDLVMTNTAVFDVFGQFIPMESLTAISNIYEFILTNEDIKKHLVNWDQLAPKILALIRQEVFEINSVSEAHILLKRLEHSTGISHKNLCDADSEELPLFTMKYDFGETKLNFFSTYTTFGTPHDVALQELRIECFYPADAVTREYCLRVSSTKNIR